MRLGITTKRDSRSFANAIKKLGNNYEKYNKSVENFKSKLKWNNVADQHIQLYNSAKKNVITIK